MSSFTLVISGKGFQQAGSLTAYSVTKVSTKSVNSAYVRVMGGDTDVVRQVIGSAIKYKLCKG